LISHIEKHLKRDILSSDFNQFEEISI